MRTVLLSYATVVRRVSSGVRLETGERVKRSPVSFNCTHFTPVGVECQAGIIEPSKGVPLINMGDFSSRTMVCSILLPSTQ